MLWRELIGYQTISWWRDRSLHQFWKNKLNFWHSNNKIRTTWKLFKKCVILFMTISSKSMKFSRNKNNNYLYEDEPHPDFLKLLLVSNGQFCNLFDWMVPSAVIPRAFTLVIRGIVAIIRWIVAKRLSKRKVWCLCCGRCFFNRITDPSNDQFSAPTFPLPLYKKTSCIIPNAPALAIILSPNFTGFLGLYYCIPLLLVLAGMICSSIDITSSGSTFKQFGCTISSNGRTLNSLSCFFHLLMICQRDQLNYINLYISSLIMWQQLY